MDFNTIAAIAIAVITPSLAYYFGLRSRLRETRSQYKQERYESLVILLEKAFMGRSASTEKKQQFYGEFYRSWLYCSSEVVEAVNDFRRLFEGNQLIVDPDKANPCIEKIVLAMRRDLGMKSPLKQGSLYYTQFHEE